MAYSLAEEKFHARSHLLGVALILVMTKPLLDVAPTRQAQIGLWVFVLTFFMVFAASSIYHASTNPSWKRRLKKIDHISIYFFIAGSNTPYLWSVSDHPLARHFLAVMWLIVGLGTIYKWMEWDKIAWISLLIYLTMGWLGLITLYLIFQVVATGTIIFIIVGGCFYTIGAYFYHYDDLKWYHSIWHLFVLFGALTHYAAIFHQLKVSG